MNIKKTFLFIFSAVALSAFCEDSAFDREFPLWKKSSPKQVFKDTDCKVRGGSSIRIENGGTALRSVELEPDTEYELTFYVKGKDIQSGTFKQGKYVKPNGGRIQLHNNQSWIRITSDPMNRKLETGTFDWRFGKRTVQSSTWKTGKIFIELAVRGKGTIWFDEVQLKKVKKNDPEASFRKIYGKGIKSMALVPQGCFGFFDPGEKVRFKVYCQSNAGKLEYAYRVKDENGKWILSVPRRTLEKEFTLPGQPCGYYVVEADFFADGKKAGSLQSAFAVTRQIPKPDPFFRIGHGIHQRYYDGFKRIGVGSACIKLGWLDPKDTPEEMWNYSYNTVYKRFLDEKYFELTISPRLHYTRNLRTARELSDGWPILNDKIYLRFLEYLDIVLAHTGKRSKTWQFQLELPTSAAPNSNNERTWSEAMSNFMIMTRIGARHIRKFDPSIKILAGGNNIQKNTGDIERIVMGDLVRDFDQYIIDAYTGHWDMMSGKSLRPEVAKMSFYEDASRLSESLGKGKIIGNAESGYAISYGAPFDRGMAVTQAQYTARELIISKAGPVSFYELHTPTLQHNTGEMQDSSRIMTTVWKPVWFNREMYQVPLPGGAMYATATSLLAFVKNPLYFHDGNNYAAVFSKPDGKSLLVLWNIEKEFPFRFTFPSDTEMVTMYGRESVIPKGKCTEIRLTGSPLYFTVDMPVKLLAQKVRNELKKQSPQIRCGGYETGPGEGKVFIRNISGETQSGTLQGRKISIPPQQTVSVTLKKSASGIVFQSADGRKYPVELKKNHWVKIPYLHRKPLLDGSGKWLKTLKKNTLSYPGDIYPVTALQEELCYFKSKRNPGGHNVSADYVLAYDKDHFYLGVEVDDHVHIQRQKGKSIWMDDSIQFVFDNREHPPRELAGKAEKVVRPAYNFALALTKQGPEFVSFSGKKTDINSCKVNVTRKGRRTFYEVCIPFKIFGQKPACFSFAVFDNNFLTKKSAPYHLRFAGGVSSDQDVSELKKLIYEKANTK